MSLTGIWLPNNAKDALDQLATEGKQTDIGVQSCNKLNPAVKQQWVEWYATLQKFCSQTPVWFLATGANEVVTDGALADQIQSYQAQLFAWEQRLVGLGCGKVFANNPARPTFSPETLTAIRWGVVGVGALSIAYVVGKVANAATYYRGTSVYNRQIRDIQRERRRLVRRR